MLKPSRIAALLVVLLVNLVPGELFACAVCAGDKNSQMGKAADAGVLTLLFIIMAVLATVAVFFVYIVRRAARLEQQNLQNPISSSSPKLVLTHD